MEYTDALLDEAKRMAHEAHFMQVDKAGEDYYRGHLRRVSNGVEGNLRKIVAYLHDSVEDTAFSIGRIRCWFGDEVADAVNALTRRDGEDYIDYIFRVSDNPIATDVKIADLIDNMNLARLPEVTMNDCIRQTKYCNALTRLIALRG